MLVLHRAYGERIRIQVGEVVIWVTPSSFSPKGVRIAVDAPREVQVDREEVAVNKERDRLAKKLGY